MAVFGFLEKKPVGSVHLGGQSGWLRLNLTFSPLMGVKEVKLK
jgi:hypothetical protein